jgi:hypothetical protein
VVNDTTITISGENITRIEWVIDGAVVRRDTTTGSASFTVDDSMSYVRAQLIGTNGMALTQPFGVQPGDGFLPRPLTNNLVSVDEPNEINVGHGAALTATGLRLPSQVTAVSEKKWRARANVSWNLAEVQANYNPANINVQTFRIPGTITLPASMTNSHGASLDAFVTVHIGVDPTISIAEANSLSGEIVTVEGYVTAWRRDDTPGLVGVHDPQRFVIQDSTDPWGGIFITDTNRILAGNPDDYIGQWVSVTGRREAQWANNAIRQVTNITLLPDDPRGGFEPLDLTLDDFDHGHHGQWNSMLISLTAQVLKRDYNPHGPDYPNIHLIRDYGGGHADVLTVLPENVQDGDWFYVDKGIMHWRSDFDGHRVHTDWAGAIGVATKVGQAAQLEAPTGLEISGTLLTWDAVTSAIGYVVYVDGYPQSDTLALTAESFDLALLNLDAGTYLVQVRAIADGTAHSDSELSTAVDFVMVPVVPITSIRINAIAIETVKRGEIRSFTVTLNEGASDASINWRTANPALATVDENGTVTVKNVIGTVVLTATDPVSGRSHSVLLRIAS